MHLKSSMILGSRPLSCPTTTSAPMHHSNHQDNHEQDEHHGHGHGLPHLDPIDTVVNPPAKRATVIFSIALALNLALVAAQLAAGHIAHSSALMADAGHNLSDALGLALALAAAIAGSRAPAGIFTYGLRGSSILAALANGTILMAASVAIGAQALGRLVEPSFVQSGLVVALAIVGIVVNGACALMIARLGQADLNARAAYAHMAADAGISASVAAGAAAIAWTGWLWIDPAMSLAIVAWIGRSSWRLMSESLRLALSATPSHIQIDSVRAHLEALPGVRGSHDLHVWALSTTETALTVHLTMGPEPVEESFLTHAGQSLAKNFGIVHATIQIESGLHPCSCPLMARPAGAALAHKNHAHGHGHSGHGH
jgi:cobalt-zinc-cadmium efflux system protein